MDIVRWADIAFVDKNVQLRPKVADQINFIGAIFLL